MDIPGVREIDHTADAGIRITAPSLESLFTRAAEGMFRLVLPREAASVTTASVRIEMEFSADTAEALLRDWLAELLYRHCTERILFSDFRMLKLSQTYLKASAVSSPMTSGEREDATEIKAVTWHGLNVTRTGEGWTAEVIFDT